MIWRNSIYDLAYYNTPKGAPCYCEQLVYPSDLVLQGVLPTTLTTGFSMKIQVMSADGLTVYENASSYFNVYYFNYNGVTYFNLRLASYSPAMCTYKCWILNVYVGNNIVLFDKWTERYCQSACCDTPRDITATIDGATITPTTVTAPALPTADCGKPLIRIRSVFDCVDNYNSDFYGTPTNVTQGTASFTFQKITNIVARFRQRPREITREISYNCNLQRSESFKPFLLESFSEKGVFPAWKMDELEVMFHANHIYISDFIEEAQYQFAGGVLCEKIGLPCWETFKLKTIIQECTIRQLFGCAENCEISGSLSFLVPEGSNGQYYTENKVLIGDYDDLLDWYRNQSGITSVTDTTGEFDNTDHSFEVEGTGYIPTYFYSSSLTNSDKVFGTTTPEAPVILCAMPVVGEIVIEADVCATPVIGTIQIEIVADEEVEINDYGTWDVDQDNSGVTIVGNSGRISLETVNTTPNQQWITDIIPSAGNTITDGRFDGKVVKQVVYAGQPYDTDFFTQVGDTITMTDVIFSGGDEAQILIQSELEAGIVWVNEPIGQIKYPGWPSVPQDIVIDDDHSIMIDLNGIIYWNGTSTSEDGSGYNISISNIFYNLT